MLKSKILTLPQGNPKTAKAAKYGYHNAVMHLAPFDLSGNNVCPMAELAGCVAGCLNTAGRGGISAGSKTTTAPSGATIPDNVIQAARIARTQHFFKHREQFMEQLEKEVKAAQRKADKHGLTLAIRLNGTSDIRWEAIRYGTDKRTILEAFPSVQWYDYTKLSNRRAVPKNYHLTWSYSAANPLYKAHASIALANGLNIAVVFQGTQPSTFLGRKVIDGDKHDLRFLDPTRSIVGLKAKGRARKDTSGFVVHTNA